jgi:hypothetical protein
MQRFSLRDVAFVSAAGGGAAAPVNPTEDWESYSVGDALVQTLNGGIGWVGPWVTADNLSQKGLEDWESYSVGDATVQTLNGGTGWSGAWVTRT